MLSILRGVHLDDALVKALVLSEVQRVEQALESGGLACAWWTLDQRESLQDGSPRITAEVNC